MGKLNLKDFEISDVDSKLSIACHIYLKHILGCQFFN